MGHSQRHHTKCVHRHCDYVTTSTPEDRIHNVIHQWRSTKGHKECLLCPNASKHFAPKWINHGVLPQSWIHQWRSTDGHKEWLLCPYVSKHFAPEWISTCLQCKVAPYIGQDLNPVPPCKQISTLPLY